MQHLCLAYLKFSLCENIRKDKKITLFHPHRGVRVYSGSNEDYDNVDVWRVRNFELALN